MSNVYVYTKFRGAGYTKSKQELIEIFSNSDILIIFTNEIFDDDNILTINNSNSKLIEDLKSELEKQKLLINELMNENKKLKIEIEIKKNITDL